ncbi:MAG: ParA-like protein, partial [uncultured Blastococcus sp.]
GYPSGRGLCRRAPARQRLRDGGGFASGPGEGTTAPPARAQAPHRARARSCDRDVQPEGRRRQDDVHHQPGCRADRVRPARAAHRPRPAGCPVGRARDPGSEHGPDDLQRAHGAEDDAGRRPRADRRPRPGPGAEQHRPLGRRGAAGERGGPRADAAAGARRRPQRLRLHPHRLPAVAGPAHGQRPDRGPGRDHPAGVRVLLPARGRPARRHDRQGQGAAEPVAGDLRDPRDDVRLAHRPLPRGVQPGGRGLRRHRVPDRHPAHRAVPGDHGRRSADHDLGTDLRWRSRLPRPRQGGAGTV